MKVREAIQVYEDVLDHLFDSEVKLNETYFGASFTNCRRVKREALSKAGKMKAVEVRVSFSRSSLAFMERTDGLIYVESVEDITKETLQDIIDDGVSIQMTIYLDTWRSYRGRNEPLTIIKPLITV